MHERELGLFIVAAGGVAIVVGLIVALGGLSWFGRLPGDARIDRGSVRVFAPITSMLLLSVGLSLVLALLRRLR